MTTAPLPPRPEPLTESERRLHELGKETFLSLWSYPGVYRDQGTGGGRHGGKEVCDLLVVFERDVIIFSDKTCDFPSTGDTDLDWSRWYDRAIRKSVKQARGAERWIREHPDRLYIDRSCKHPFPYPLPSPEVARYHKVVVAGGAAKGCQEEFGGSGSLMIRIGDASDSATPPAFTLAPISLGDALVHVFDDRTMALALQVFDTISDFVAYLSAKEDLVRSGRAIWAAGEEDLIARYVTHLEPSGAHGFSLPPRADVVLVEEGAWDDVQSNPQWQAKLAADRISYAWDSLIEKFTYYAARGESEFEGYTDLAGFEEGIRFLAREPRVKRRMLADAFLGIMHKAGPGTERANRVLFPLEPGDPYYVFLALHRPSGVSREKYRISRRELLKRLCLATRARWEEAEDIVGLATEPMSSSDRSEDLLYLNGREWSEEAQAEAQASANELGLFKKLQLHQGHDKEYPDLPGEPAQPYRKRGLDIGRNDPCPCQSGRKFKKCCGRPG